MIDLDGLTPFAEGGNRKCFIHPDNPNRCLKVVHPGLLEKIRSVKPVKIQYKLNQKTPFSLGPKPFMSEYIIKGVLPKLNMLDSMSANSRMISSTKINTTDIR